MSTKRKIAIIGLGYVGLPVATTFAREGFKVVGFDVSQKRIKELKNKIDKTNEVSSHELKSKNLNFTYDKSDLKKCDFYIVTVPTPINNAKQPDLSILKEASKTIGSVLNCGDIVVYESTVYPGATEEDCVPILEETSGLKYGVNFKVGYSPERINPGDKEHRFDKIKKVVSGQDEEALNIIADVYGSVVTAGIHKAPTIKTAEAAKVIENTQRDINIALMNELALICEALEIDTNDVLEAAATKWNFLKFYPGFVGGHCISVDPYYLTHRAERSGLHPRVILAGRRINDEMGKTVARHLVKKLIKQGSNNFLSVNFLGFTFKENVPDIRNTRVIDVVNELKAYGISTAVHDALACPEETKNEYGIKLQTLDSMEPADALVLAVPHQYYMDMTWSDIQKLLKDGKGIILDLKSRLDRSTTPEGITLWRL